MLKRHRFCTCYIVLPEWSGCKAIVSYILSDTIGPQAGALRWHQVAGKVVNPETSAPIEDVDVVLIALRLQAVQMFPTCTAPPARVTTYLRPETSGMTTKGMMLSLDATPKSPDLVPRFG